MLVIHVELIDLKSSPATDQVLDWATGFRFRVAPGHLTLVAELRDGGDDRVVARLADLEDPQGERELWSSVGRSLASWGEVLAATMVTRSTENLVQR